MWAEATGTTSKPDAKTTVFPVPLPSDPGDPSTGSMSEQLCSDMKGTQHMPLTCEATEKCGFATAASAARAGYDGLYRIRTHLNQYLFLALPPLLPPSLHRTMP